MIIEQPAIFLRWLYPQALWRMDRKERAVYLTFDDGPIPEVTPWVLDVLDHYGIKATWWATMCASTPRSSEWCASAATASATTLTTT